MSAKLQVKVFDFKNNQLRNATVVILYPQTPTSTTVEIGLRLPLRDQIIPLNSMTGYYETQEFPKGRYWIRVSAPGFAEQKRQIENSDKGASEIFVLGKENMPFYYRGKVKVPFEPFPGHIAVGIREEQQKMGLPLLFNLTKELKLTQEKVGENILRNGFYVFKFPEGIQEYEKLQKQKVLNDKDYTSVVAPLLKLSDQNLTMLSDEIVVQFKTNVKPNEVENLTVGLELQIIRKIPYLENTYQFKHTTDIITLNILTICQKLVDSGRVEYAEPNLYHTAQDDATVPPKDYLFKLQWDHGYIKTLEAWEKMKKVEGAIEDVTYGDRNIKIAVVDDGIDTAHPKFADKIDKLCNFNVSPIRADNAPLTNSHGTCCAGAVAALVNNTEGTVGIAPNCHLMGIKKPLGASGKESLFADIYVWLAGFESGNNMNGFPSNIQSGGADIITNSFGYAIGIPIMETMARTFDFITTNGRNGNGVILFFSAGNGNISNLNLVRPWGAYEKCILVAASKLSPTRKEIRAGYSNYGPEIDLCAPSSGEESTHNPPNNYKVLTTTRVGMGELIGSSSVSRKKGNYDYFGGTSYATPVCAGVAALVLSVNKELTWEEVRNILRETADKIDAANATPNGQWVVLAGQDFSQYYGYGRVNAAEAVKKAISTIPHVRNADRIIEITE